MSPTAINGRLVLLQLNEGRPSRLYPCLALVTRPHREYTATRPPYFPLPTWMCSVDRSLSDHPGLIPPFPEHVTSVARSVLTLLHALWIVFQGFDVFRIHLEAVSLFSLFQILLLVLRCFSIIISPLFLRLPCYHELCSPHDGTSEVNLAFVHSTTVLTFLSKLFRDRCGQLLSYVRVGRQALYVLIR